MGIRHVALFRFVEGTTPDQVDALTAELRALPETIPELSGYRVGPDLGLNADSWDYCVVADCDDVDGYRAYVAHPDHQRALADVIRPILAARSSVQYET
jgi:hypothetical protein